MEGGFLTPKPTPRARRAKRRGAGCPTLKDLALAALVEALDGEANESSSLEEIKELCTSIAENWPPASWELLMPHVSHRLCLGVHACSGEEGVNARLQKMRGLANPALIEAAIRRDEQRSATSELATP